MNKRQWAGLIVLLIFLVTIAAMALLKTPEQPASEPEIASIKLESGHRFVIHRAKLASEMEIESLESGWKQSGWIKSIYSDWNTSTWGQNPDFEMEVRKAYGDFASARFMRQRDSLILLARLFDAEGNPVVSDSVFLQSSGQVREIQWQAGTGIFDSFENTEGTAKCTVEVSDGANGWRRMTGPVIPHRKDGRGFVAAPVFPRTTAHLKLRVSYNGSPSKTLSLPNPGYRPSFPAWTADPKPWHQELGEVAVSIAETQWLQSNSRAFPDLDLNIHPGIDQKPEAWRTEFDSISDRFGNRATPDLFEPLAGTKLLRFHYQIARSREFVWPASEVRVLGELTWPGGDQAVEATLTEMAKKQGIRELTLKPGKTERNGRLWQIYYEGEHSGKAFQPDSNRPLTLFLGENRESSGAPRFGSSGGYKSFGGTTTFDYEVRWIGEIQPGQRVRIAWPDAHPPIPFHFTLPLKAFPSQS